MSQSLARALHILADLAGGERSLEDLAGSVGVHKTTVLRLLRNLEDERFVRRESQRFRLGSRLFELGTNTLRENTIRDIAIPHLTRLARESGGQAVHLATYDGTQASYLATVESTAVVRTPPRVGQAAALHATAVGKILLCGLPTRHLAAALQHIDYDAFTARTITTVEALRTELVTTRARGWATDIAEHADFVTCLGVSVRDSTGRVIAAVSISAPENVLTAQRMRAVLPTLRGTAKAIEADWAAPRPHQVRC